MDPWSWFLYGIKVPMTRERYRVRLAMFFDFIGFTIGKERAKVFTERDKKEPDWVFVNVLRFAQVQKERVEKGEISAAIIRNYIKGVKLFCETLLDHRVIASDIEHGFWYHHPKIEQSHNP
jgi:hypothetical protein